MIYDNKNKQLLFKDDKTFIINTDHINNILSIKTYIAKELNKPIEVLIYNFDLYSNNKLITNENLNSLNDLSIIYLKFKNISNLINVFIKIDKSYCLTIPSDLLVGNLRDIIAAKYNIYTDKYILIGKNKLLYKNDLLSKYKIENDNTIELRFTAI